jgi:hypothetical protein
LCANKRTITVGRVSAAMAIVKKRLITGCRVLGTAGITEKGNRLFGCFFGAALIA